MAQKGEAEVTIDEQMVAAEKYEELWDAMMPDADSPEEDQFLLWAGSYSEELVSRGINRVARKYRKMRDTSEPMSLNDMVRYASSVMKNEGLGIRHHPH